MLYGLYALVKVLFAKDTGATKAATAGSGTIAAAMWTFVVVFAIVLLVLERRARRAGRPSILAGS